MNKLVLVLVIAFALAACAEEAGPTVVSEEIFSPDLASLTSNLCALNMVLLSQSDSEAIFQVLEDYNVEEEPRPHGSPVNCTTVLRSSVANSLGETVIVYHNYGFWLHEIYEWNSLGQTSEGNYAGQIDCGSCSDIRFTSRAPDPGFVTSTYAVGATNVFEGNSVPVRSASTEVCTLDGGMSPATATLVAPGRCILETAYNDILGEWDVQQSFDVVLPWTAGADTGSNVLAETTNEVTGEVGPVALTFDSVTTAGSVTVTTETVYPDSDPLAPSNFQLGDPPTYYNITMSEELVFEGLVEVCITYNEEDFADTTEAALEILHWDGELWVTLSPQTISQDTNVICGFTDAFSPFTIGQRLIDDRNGKGKSKAKAKGRS